MQSARQSCHQNATTGGAGSTDCRCHRFVIRPTYNRTGINWPESDRAACQKKEDSFRACRHLLVRAQPVWGLCFFYFYAALQLPISGLLSDAVRYDELKSSMTKISSQASQSAWIKKIDPAVAARAVPSLSGGTCAGWIIKIFPVPTRRAAAGSRLLQRWCCSGWNITCRLRRGSPQSLITGDLCVQKIYGCRLWLTR